MGEEIDVESVREVMFQYFADSQRIVERHAGQVEKFIGDAILAVFGLPVTREDDAFRAVRAGLEIQSHTNELNIELDRRFGRIIELRIGINSGEFIAGYTTRSEPLVAGDVANVAARLEQAADPGEILIGERTHRLTRALVETLPIGPLELKGKSQPMPAYRVVGLKHDSVPTPARAASPFVGRRAELADLRDEYKRCVEGMSFRVVRLTSDAGLGKSRLAAEFLDSIGEEATVLSGRCLPHGDGSTYRPLLDFVSQIAPSMTSDPLDAFEERLTELVDDNDSALVTRALARATGLLDGSTSQSEIAWAIRALLESLATRRPVVILLDDLHWADPTLLDVMGSVADRIAPVPVLVLLAGRPPARSGGALERYSSTDIELRPLADADSAKLIDYGIGAALNESEQRALIERAGGNPLYVEELLSMLIDDGMIRIVDGLWQTTGPIDPLTIPPTIETLLDSRIDALPEPARLVIERAAIEGQTFSRPAITALMGPDERDLIDQAISALVGRDLIVEQSGDTIADDRTSYRFRHVLIRDVAYRRTPKRIRSELHERFASWLDESGLETSADADEMAGYHLEQAYRYRAELFRPGPSEVLLAARAAGKLEHAGQRALSKSDLGGAIGLLRRSVSLLGDELSLRLQPLLGGVLGEAGRLSEAMEVLDQLVDRATEVGSAQLVAQGRIEQMILRLQTDPADVPEQVRVQEATLREPLESLGYPAGLARFWHLKALVHWNEVQCGAAAESWKRAARYARLARDHRRVADALSWQASAAYYGPMPADESLAVCEDITRQLGEDRLARSQVMLSMACLNAMSGRRKRARSLVAESDRIIEAIGQNLHSAAPHREAFVAMVCGDPSDAERRLTLGSEHLRSIGEHALLSTNAAMTAHALLAQDRHDEAYRLTLLSEHEANADDVATHIAWRTARAKVYTQWGRHNEAIELATAAVDLAGKTDCLVDQADATRDLAEILIGSGDDSQGGKLLAAATELYERKGHIVGAGACRTRETALGLSENGIRRTQVE